MVAIILFVVLLISYFAQIKITYIHVSIEGIINYIIWLRHGIIYLKISIYLVIARYEGVVQNTQGIFHIHLCPRARNLEGLGSDSVALGLGRAGIRDKEHN